MIQKKQKQVNALKIYRICYRVCNVGILLLELCEPYQETTRVETEPNHLGNISNTHMGVVGNRQKKTKRKFPAVATSEGWAEIYIQGEQEKMEKENAKKRRIEERENKKKDSTRGTEKKVGS